MPALLAPGLVPALPALARDVIPMPDERFGGLQAVQVVGIVLCIVIPLIGWALLVRQVGRFVSLYRLGQPDAGRTDAPLTRTLGAHQGVPRAHPDVAAEGRRGGALVHRAVLHHPVRDAGQRVPPAGAARLPAPAHRALPAVRVARRGLRLGRVHRHRRARRHPAEEPPALGRRERRAQVAVLRVDVLAGLLRRGDDPLRHDLHPAAARPRGGVRHAARARGVARRALPAHRLDGRASGRRCRCRRSRPGSTSWRR